MRKPQNSRAFKNIFYYADCSGTGQWRYFFPYQSINCIAHQLNVSNIPSNIPITDQNYYKNIDQVMVQRWLSPMQERIYSKFLKPLCDNNNAWLIYNIDDAMGDDDIPLYNRGRAAFSSQATQESIKKMLNISDFVLTTTPYIKNYYHEKYGVPLENIVTIPNLLPKWWIGGKYDPQRRIEDFKRFKSKPRVGIISSLSHYNIDNLRQTIDHIPVHEVVEEVNGQNVSHWLTDENKEVKFEDTLPIVDDLDGVLDIVKSTVNKIQWVFLGYVPPQLKEYAKAKKIECYHGVPLLNYPEMLSNLRLQCIVAPLKDCTFNRCKSNIKYTEAAALGIPLLAQNMCTYSDYMDERWMFKDVNELYDKLFKLIGSSTGAFEKCIDHNWKFINSPREECGFSLSNWWLEDNLQIWIDFFKMRPKMSIVDMSRFVELYKARKQEEKNNLLFKADNGVEILK